MSSVREELGVAASGLPVIQQGRRRAAAPLWIRAESI
jgi:hypothetical protein